MTQSPFFDRIMVKNRIADRIRQLLNRTASLSILSFVADAINERRDNLANGEVEKAEKADESGRTDFLTRYIEIQEKNPEIPPW